MSTLSARAARHVAVIGAVAGLITAASGCTRAAPAPSRQAVEARRDLFEELRPTTLANCRLKRYGAPHDGGYLMCENLMGEARSAYSYGIDGRDEWGCDVAQQIGAGVHEYDCFNLTRPACDRGSLLFHAECIGTAAETIGGRSYDTLADQIQRNGDADRRFVVKIDVEGAEWASLQNAPDDLLDRIDQLAIELHGTDDPAFVEMVRKLKRHFYVAHVHANNYTCNARLAPFTAAANEILFVNRRIAVVASAAVPPLPNALDAPNRTGHPDCPPHF